MPGALEVTPSPVPKPPLVQARENDGASILSQLIVGLPHVIEPHQAAMGNGWGIACDFAELHADILRRLSRALGSGWSEQEQGLLLLGSHAFNVFTAAMGAACRGEFDTIQYFTRAAFDAASLLSVCAHSAEHAGLWRSGELKASQARKDFVRELREGGEQTLADEIDRILRENAKAADEAAHFGLIHADKLLDKREDGALTPILGGRSDSQEAVRHVEMNLGLEFKVLMNLAVAFVAPPYDGEQERLSQLHDRLSAWRAALLD